MSQKLNFKQYDLEDRTLEFSKKVRVLVKKLPITTANVEDGKQLIRSSGSVGANYIEANESLSKKGFLLRIKICKKEAKENRYWLMLVNVNTPKLVEIKKTLIQEATELMKIFGSILEKSK